LLEQSLSRKSLQQPVRQSARGQEQDVAFFLQRFVRCQIQAERVADEPSVEQLVFPPLAHSASAVPPCTRIHDNEQVAPDNVPHLAQKPSEVVRREPLEDVYEEGRFGRLEGRELAAG